MPDTYLLRPEAAEFLTERGFPTTKLTLQKLATTGGHHAFRAARKPGIGRWVSLTKRRL